MIPIIIGVAAVGTSVFGAGHIISGLGDIERANQKIEYVKKLYEIHIEKLENKHKQVNDLASEYGNLQIQVRLDTIKRYIKILEKINSNASQKLEYLEEIGISIDKLEKFKKIVIDLEDLLKTIPNSVAAGASSAGAAWYAAQSFGTVAMKTTVSKFFGLFSKEVVEEVAISKLAGATAFRGMTTWLGGGSAALGGLSFGLVTLAPTLVFTGFELSKNGKKALTQACKKQQEVNVEIKKIDKFIETLSGVEKRILEMQNLVTEINSKAIACLKSLENTINFSCEISEIKEKYGSGIYQLFLLITALSELLNTSILNEHGTINEESIIVYEKYITLG